MENASERLGRMWTMRRATGNARESETTEEGGGDEVDDRERERKRND
jgi:hypothetical protein